MSLGEVSSVVLCDDQVEMREALVGVLGTLEHLDVVGQAQDGEECLAQITDLRPHLLILDVNLPGGGPRLVEALKEAHPTLRIVVFTARQDGETHAAMLGAGAEAVVMKTGRMGPLLAALEARQDGPRAPVDGRIVVRSDGDDPRPG